MLIHVPCVSDGLTWTLFLWDEALFDISGEPRDMAGEEWEGAIAVSAERMYSCTSRTVNATYLCSTATQKTWHVTTWLDQIFEQPTWCLRIFALLAGAACQSNPQAQS